MFLPSPFPPSSLVTIHEHWGKTVNIYIQLYIDIMIMWLVLRASPRWKGLSLHIIRAEKNTKSPEYASSKPKKHKKVPKNKLQKPDMNSRWSEYYYPPSDKNFAANRSDSSVRGAAVLREKRRLLDDEQNHNSPIMIATAAAALTATIIRTCAWKTRKWTWVWCTWIYLTWNYSCT